jgi:hypothetical protein
VNPYTDTAGETVRENGMQGRGQPLRSVGCCPHTGQFSDFRQFLSLYCGGSCEMDADTASPRLATREASTSILVGAGKQRWGRDAQAQSREVRSSVCFDIDGSDERMRSYAARVPSGFGARF